MLALEVGEVHEFLATLNYPFPKVYYFDPDPLSPLLWLYDLFLYVKGVLEVLTLKDLTSCGCSEDEKVQELVVDDGDVKVVVGWAKMEGVGERGGG